VVGAYKRLSRKSTYIGWISVLSSILVMTYYTALGGYCLRYFFINVKAFILDQETISSELLLDNCLRDIPSSVFFALLFIVFCYVILSRGISKGIEKFNIIVMPLLFVMLLISIGISLTFDGAVEVINNSFLKFDNNTNFFEVIINAGEQMFFSLSIAMGSMVTYGAYMTGRENIVKNSVIIAASDTLIAFMAALAVIPAAFSTHSGENQDGPKLLFVTLQEVFSHIGRFGYLFCAMFFLLVIFAAVSSAVAIVEVPVSVIMESGFIGRKVVIFFCCVLIFIPSIIITADGMGVNSIAIPFADAFKSAKWNRSWLEFVTFISEGILMPITALFSSIYIGWIKGPEIIIKEQKDNSLITHFFKKTFVFTIKFLVPIIVLLIIFGQIATFFSV
jgi:NSS family neurotransmitter:Na+ symporter